MITTTCMYSQIPGGAETLHREPRDGNHVCVLTDSWGCRGCIGVNHTAHGVEAEQSYFLTVTTCVYSQIPGGAEVLHSVNHTADQGEPRTCVLHRFLGHAEVLQCQSLISLSHRVEATGYYFLIASQRYLNSLNHPFYHLIFYSPSSICVYVSKVDPLEKTTERGHYLRPAAEECINHLRTFAWGIPEHYTSGIPPREMHNYP